MKLAHREGHVRERITGKSVYVLINSNLKPYLFQVFLVRSANKLPYYLLSFQITCN